MENKNLERIIRERTKRAIKLDLVNQVNTIAAWLGKYSKKYNKEDFTETAYQTFRYKEIELVRVQGLSEMSGGPASLVYHRGNKGQEKKLVFDGYCNDGDFYNPNGISTIRAYIPGDWERHLPDLYREAVAKEIRTRAEEQQRMERWIEKERIRKWGI